MTIRKTLTNNLTKIFSKISISPNANLGSFEFHLNDVLILPIVSSLESETKMLNQLNYVDKSNFHMRENIGK